MDEEERMQMMRRIFYAEELDSIGNAIQLGLMALDRRPFRHVVEFIVPEPEHRVTADLIRAYDKTIVALIGENDRLRIKCDMPRKGDSQPASPLPHRVYDRICRKCGAEPFRDRLCTDKGRVSACNVQGEHLHVDCECGYSWLTQCMDAPGAPKNSALFKRTRR